MCKFHVLFFHQFKLTLLKNKNQKNQKIKMEGEIKELKEIKNETRPNAILNITDGFTIVKIAWHDSVFLCMYMRLIPKNHFKGGKPIPIKEIWPRISNLFEQPNELEDLCKWQDLVVKEFTFENLTREKTIEWIKPYNHLAAIIVSNNFKHRMSGPLVNGLIDLLPHVAPVCDETTYKYTHSIGSKIKIGSNSNGKVLQIDYLYKNTVESICLFNGNIPTLFQKWICGYYQSLPQEYNQFAILV